MEPEMNNETWNDDYQPETQTNPSEQHTQSPTASFFQSPQLQKKWLNVTLANWIKCLIVVALLSMAALIAPRFTSADEQQDTASYFQTEDDWYDYDYGYED
jgi:hypothetical protein